MSSTKIINVLKDDSFKEILDIFKSASASEVIFVLPKTSRAFQKEEHFSILQNEAKNLDKAVSFLCSNPQTNDQAKQHGFDVLLSRPVSPSRSSRNNRPNSISVVNQIEDFYHTSKNDSEISLPINTSARMIEDVIEPNSREQISVDIDSGKEKNIPVDVHKNTEYELRERKALQEIEQIWQPSVTSTMRRENNQPQFWQNWFKSSKLSVTRRSKPRYQHAVAALSIMAVIVFGIIVYVSTGNAKITIKPKSQPLTIPLNITVADSTASIDLAGLKIPGQLFHIQKTVSEEFPATGQKDVAQKARGTMAVYNELSVDQPLVATTRFQSSDDYIFRTLTSIVVPAAKTQNGKSIPGKVDVQVIADKAGQNYNVPAGDFTITAFKEKGDTVKYENIYGKSAAAMRGGTSGKANVVTEKDYNDAKEALASRLETAINDQLKAEMDGFKVINESEPVTDIVDSSSGTDEAADTFTMSVSGYLKTIGFKESDLLELINKYVQSKQNLSIVPEKIILNYNNIQFDGLSNTLQFSVSVEGPGYQIVDQNKLVSDLMGKKTKEIKEYLKGVPEVASANVILSPMWVRSIPKDETRIRIDFSY